MTKEQINELRAKDLKKKANRIAYLQELIEEEDWHGIQDVASDIREIVERLLMYSYLEADNGGP